MCFVLFCDKFVIFKLYITHVTTCIINNFWGWHPLFGKQYSCRGSLDRTQYAKGRYAVRRNSVISYADINFYFKKVIFLLLNGTQYARPKHCGTQYARPKKGGTQYARGEGVSPSFLILSYLILSYLILSYLILSYMVVFVCDLFVIIRRYITHVTIVNTFYLILSYFITAQSGYNKNTAFQSAPHLHGAVTKGSDFKSFSLR